MSTLMTANQIEMLSQFETAAAAEVSQFLC